MQSGRPSEGTGTYTTPSTGMVLCSSPTDIADLQALQEITCAIVRVYNPTLGMFSKDMPRLYKMCVSMINSFQARA